MESIDALARALSPVAVAMIRGEMSAAVLVRAAKIAYVRAAIAETNPGNFRTNISRLSVITGLTRKEVSSLLDEAVDGRGTSRTRLMEHRALRVMHGWATDPFFKSPTGRPIDLPIEGEGRNFAALVRAYGGDVTPMAVFRELERLKAIRRIDNGKIRARVRPAQLGSRSVARFKAFGQLLAGFSNTVSQLLVEQDPPLYFGFKELTPVSETQAASFKASFSRRAALLLEGVEHWKRRQPAGSQRVAQGTSRAQHVGLGVYLVQEPCSKSPEPRRRSRKR